MRLRMTLVMPHAPSELVRSNRDSVTLMCDASFDQYKAFCLRYIIISVSILRFRALYEYFSPKYEL